jgi:hypothetical protein
MEKGCAVHPATLISAAMHGDLASVRCLHSHGLPLWEGAWEEEQAGAVAWYMLLCPQAWRRNRLIAIPKTPEGAERMWSTLHYGWAMGAPVTHMAEDVLRSKRAATRTVLLCFHVAAGLSDKAESEEERAAWSAMGCIPTGVIDKILLQAGLEIPESLHRNVPRERSVVDEREHVVCSFKPMCLWVLPSSPQPMCVWDPLPRPLPHHKDILGRKNPLGWLKQRARASEVMRVSASRTFRIEDF